MRLKQLKWALFGDFNVCLSGCFHDVNFVYFKDDATSVTSASNTDTTSRSRSGTPTIKTNGNNKRGKKRLKAPKSQKSSFKFS